MKIQLPADKVNVKKLRRYIRAVNKEYDLAKNYKPEIKQKYFLFIKVSPSLDWSKRPDLRFCEWEIMLKSKNYRVELPPCFFVAKSILRALTIADTVTLENTEIICYKDIIELSI